MIRMADVLHNEANRTEAFDLAESASETQLDSMDELADMLHLSSRAFASWPPGPPGGYSPTTRLVLKRLERLALALQNATVMKWSTLQQNSKT